MCIREDLTDQKARRCNLQRRAFSAPNRRIPGNLARSKFFCPRQIFLLSDGFFGFRAGHCSPFRGSGGIPHFRRRRNRPLRIAESCLPESENKMSETSQNIFKVTTNARGRSQGKENGCRAAETPRPAPARPAAHTAMPVRRSGFRTAEQTSNVRNPTAAYRRRGTAARNAAVGGANGNAPSCASRAAPPHEGKKGFAAGHQKAAPKGGEAKKERTP